MDVYNYFSGSSTGPVVQAGQINFVGRDRLSGAEVDQIVELVEGLKTALAEREVPAARVLNRELAAVAERAVRTGDRAQVAKASREVVPDLRNLVDTMEALEALRPHVEALGKAVGEGH